MIFIIFILMFLGKIENIIDICNKTTNIDKRMIGKVMGRAAIIAIITNLWASSRV